MTLGVSPNLVLRANVTRHNWASRPEPSRRLVAPLWARPSGSAATAGPGRSPDGGAGVRAGTPPKCRLVANHPRNHRWYEEYHPFGSTAWWAGVTTILVSRKRYRYTGMERDEETGLQCHGRRHFAPWLGRWTSADPIGVSDGVNRFGYCHGGPVGGRDPSGMADIGLPWGVAEKQQKDEIKAASNPPPVPPSLPLSASGRAVLANAGRQWEAISARYVTSNRADIIGAWRGAAERTVYSAYLDSRPEARVLRLPQDIARTEIIGMTANDLAKTASFQAATASAKEHPNTDVRFQADISQGTTRDSIAFGSVSVTFDGTITADKQGHISGSGTWSLHDTADFDPNFVTAAENLLFGGNAPLHGEGEFFSKREIVTTVGAVAFIGGRRVSVESEPVPFTIRNGVLADHTVGLVGP